MVKHIFSSFRLPESENRRVENKRTVRDERYYRSRSRNKKYIIIIIIKYNKSIWEGEKMLQRCHKYLLKNEARAASNDKRNDFSRAINDARWFMPNWFFNLGNAGCLCASISRRKRWLWRSVIDFTLGRVCGCCSCAGIIFRWICCLLLWFCYEL